MFVIYLSSKKTNETRFFFSFSTFLIWFQELAALNSNIANHRAICIHLCPILLFCSLLFIWVHIPSLSFNLFQWRFCYTCMLFVSYCFLLLLLKFIYSKKAIKIWRNLQILASKKGWRFWHIYVAVLECMNFTPIVSPSTLKIFKRWHCGFGSVHAFCT